MKSAFVAGATGYTGREVVRQLREKKYHVIAHVRPDSPELQKWREYFLSLGVAVDLTPWQAKEMTQSLLRQAPSFVFALLGTTRARMKKITATGQDAHVAGYAAVDLELTRLLIDAVMHLATPPVFVYLSSAGVGPRAVGEYLKVRHVTETHLKNSGLHYVIARPGVITGPDRDDARPLERFGAALIDRVVTVGGLAPGNALARRYHSTTNKILAGALIRLAENPALHNSVCESEELR